MPIKMLQGQLIMVCDCLLLPLKVITVVMKVIVAVKDNDESVGINFLHQMIRVFIEVVNG